MTADTNTPARAVSDGRGRLISADEPLAGLQHRCGGDIPGTIAIPALLAEVRKAGEYGLKLARTIEARDENEIVTMRVELVPLEDGCEIAVRSWQTRPAPEDRREDARPGSDPGHRALADFTAILDLDQKIVAAESDAQDLRPLLRLIEDAHGRRWTDFVTIDGLEADSKLHWRLLDGVSGTVKGSARKWHARLYPRRSATGESIGFELTLTADRPLVSKTRADEATTDGGVEHMIARNIAPALRRPLARIVANAETIRARFAGPLADQYRDYAADIGEASQHLMTLLDDLGDLEAVESERFETAADRIDLADMARRAAGIVGAKAREKDIGFILPGADSVVPAQAEFRRVLQILLNLIGNAIQYGPEGSRIYIDTALDDAVARLTIRDEGVGVPAGKREAVFAKFERLGRSGDGGSGLGLYISRKLARAMGGDLVLAESEAGEGARFTLTLPRTEIE